MNLLETIGVVIFIVGGTIGIWWLLDRWEDDDRE